MWNPSSHAKPAWSAVIAAAGEGTRIGGPCKKPYLEIEGRPIVHHAIERFAALSDCAEIVVVIHPDESAAGRVASELVAAFGICKVVCGGATRQKSVMAGLEASEEATDLVLIHDAVRPLVTRRVIDNVVSAADRWGAAVAAVPATETVKRATTDGMVVETPPRHSLWFARTPQGFRRDLIVDAHRQAARDGFEGTDDAQLVERTGADVVLVEDSYNNIKITMPGDLALAEAILRRRR